MTPRSRALLLVNRKARNGAGDIAAALDILQDGGFDLVPAPAGRPSDVPDIIRAHRASVDVVIVGGGDGSLNAAAAGLLETGLPLGILPLGTANDLARTLGIPFDPVEAARVIAAGRTRAIDVGEVNGHPYFNVASIGFSATLARHLTREAKKRWGVLGYGLSAIRLLRQSHPFRVEIEHDGRIEAARTLQVSVGSGRYYGGGMQIDEAAQPDDGILRVYSLEMRHWIELIGLLPFLRRGMHGRFRNVRTLRTAALVVRTRRRHRVNADGELITDTPAHFRIHTRAIRVFVPADTLA